MCIRDSTSGNDAEGRDPSAWTLEASNNGEDWTVIDTRTNQSFSDRKITQYYTCNPEEQPYSYFRLNVTENQGDSQLQLSEWQLLFVDKKDVGIEPGLSIDAFAKIRLTDNKLYVDTPEAAQVQVYDLSGILMLNEEVQSGASAVSVSHLDKGMYLSLIHI